MPCLYRLGKLKIVMYAGDHAPPHFHLRSPDSDCQVALSNLLPLEGVYDPRELAAAIAWAADNMEILLAKWSELNERD